MYIYCIFLDLKTAFDAADHYLLLQKLEITYAFRRIALDITKSYLTDNNILKLAITIQRNKISTADFHKVLCWDLCSDGIQRVRTGSCEPVLGMSG